MVKKVEFTDDTWEERTTLYYSAKDVGKRAFASYLSSVNIDLGTYSCFISRDELLNKVDINRMAKASHLNIEEDDIILMGENEWDIKTFFIESKEHFILIAWETFA